MKTQFLVFRFLSFGKDSIVFCDLLYYGQNLPISSFVFVFSVLQNFDYLDYKIQNSHQLRQCSAEYAACFSYYRSQILPSPVEDFRYCETKKFHEKFFRNTRRSTAKFFGTETKKFDKKIIFFLVALYALPNFLLPTYGQRRL